MGRERERERERESERERERVRERERERANTLQPSWSELCTLLFLSPGPGKP